MNKSQLQEKRVSQFLGIFAEKVKRIGMLQCEDKHDQSLFQKTLYVAVLDALSKTTSYPRQGNRDRFVSLISSFADWSLSSRVSLPHLLGLLQRINSPEFSKVRASANERIDAWGGGNIITLDRDPEYRDILSLWPKNIPKPLEDVSLEATTHASLFYTYRNSLVHEFREPGKGMELPLRNEPFYFQMHDLGAKEITWELIYPITFYEKICNAIIKNLNSYYQRERINPYACYSFGSYFIGELNT